MKEQLEGIVLYLVWYIYLGILCLGVAYMQCIQYCDSIRILDFFFLEVCIISESPGIFVRWEFDSV